MWVVIALFLVWIDVLFVAKFLQQSVTFVKTEITFPHNNTKTLYQIGNRLVYPNTLLSEM